MDVRRLVRTLTGQLGVALPMALIALLILTALVVAFSVLATSEPTIAANQLRVAQARALAEAGVERATWALTNAAATGGLADPLPSPVPAPYDGSQLLMVSVGATPVGGFRVTVTSGAASNERNVVAVGWVPTDSSTDGRTKAHQRITATLTKIRFLDPPCALCVRGDLQVGGNSTIDSRSDTSCGDKSGTITTGSTTIGSGAADVWGADGNSTRNQTGTAPPADIVNGFSAASFDSYLFTSSDLDALKAIAKARGTYYQGAVTFNSSFQMPDGIIFVDTTTGNNITPSTPSSEFAALSIHGGAPAAPSGIFSGWIISNGSISISGDFRMHGMVYAVNDISYTGTGTGEIVGQMISQNIRDTVATTVDTNTGGNAAVIYNCAYAKTGGGQIPQSWFLKAGTYKEVADP
ncbi:MAG: hypothetical protein HYV93_09800 [Candidatus Rokubacteria bacterium]|nr:hypothetical protein [Candidatus Rokubacteria bacterium]